MSIDLIQDHWTSEQSTLMELALTKGRRRVNQHSQTVNIRLSRSATPWRLEESGKNTFRDTALAMHQKPVLMNEEGALQVSSMSISFHATDNGDDEIEITLGPIACRVLGLIEQPSVRPAPARIAGIGGKVKSPKQAPGGNIIYLAK